MTQAKLQPPSNRDSLPLPVQGRQAFRDFLARVKKEVFNDNAAEMGRNVGLTDKKGQRMLRRTLSGKTEKVNDEIVKNTWTYLLDKYGIDAYKFGPTPYGIAIVPRLVHRPVEDGGSYVVKPEQQGFYAIDETEIDQTLPAIDGQYFVATIEGDSMRPYFEPGTQATFEPLDETKVPKVDGIYIFRMENTIRVGRLQNLPSGEVRVIPSNDDYETYTLNKETDDYDLIGFCRGHWIRLA